VLTKSVHHGLPGSPADGHPSSSRERTMTATTMSTAWPTSALSAAQTAFAALTYDPQPPLVLDCAAFADPAWGLPDGVSTLAVLRSWMLEHPREFDARDAIWRQVLQRARQEGPQAAAWVIGAVGLAMPALLSHARTLGAGFRGDHDDLDAEILAGFLAALRGDLDLARTAPYAKLTMAAWRAGRALRAAEDVHIPVPQIPETAGSRAPRELSSHPDLMVMRAAALGLIEPQDAAAFIEVRLGNQRSETIAERLGITASALHHRLARAAEVLADALHDGLLSGPVPPRVAATLTAAAMRRCRIRAGRAIATRHNAAAPVAALRP
jgi:DNA-directed RNA polymerase specialized sigma24 family protein